MKLSTFYKENPLTSFLCTYVVVSLSVNIYYSTRKEQIPILEKRKRYVTSDANAAVKPDSSSKQVADK
ncbi:hypothetical protein EB796_004540 [Bugula neritina]|uniref:Uncharacterized protein n=1 Tax=Bugula neritina TaxID=10212 RepID=A0A7J7KEQ3_BUGNE|nr:hypothetical protein EB796_004540 [Bugula neritina]